MGNPYNHTKGTRNWPQPRISWGFISIQQRARTAYWTRPRISCLPILLPHQHCIHVSVCCSLFERSCFLTLHYFSPNIFVTLHAYWGSQSDRSGINVQYHFSFLFSRYCNSNWDYDLIASGCPSTNINAHQDIYLWHVAGGYTLRYLCIFSGLVLPYQVFSYPDHLYLTIVQRF